MSYRQTFIKSSRDLNPQERLDLLMSCAMGNKTLKGTKDLMAGKHLSDIKDTLKSFLHDKEDDMNSILDQLIRLEIDALNRAIATNDAGVQTKAFRYIQYCGSVSGAELARHACCYSAPAALAI